MAAEPTVNRVDDTHLCGKADGSPRPTKRQQLLPDREPSPATSHDKAGCDSHSGNELNNTESDKDGEEPCPMKRKRLSSFQDSLMHKKPKPVFSRGLPANIDHAPSLIGTLLSRIPHLIRLRELLRSLILRLDLLHHTPRIQTCCLTTATLTDYPEPPYPR